MEKRIEGWMETMEMDMFINVKKYYYVLPFIQEIYFYAKFNVFIYLLEIINIKNHTFKNFYCLMIDITMD